MRPLLPYEHQLIEQLGVSKEEYLDFLAVQRDCSQSIEERQQELRGDPLTTSIILTVVGILFQVASMLLMRPSLPSSRSPRQTREQRFAPRFGFNSSQELAQYGDPINLVYTNTKQNPRGGVRVATSLVWSSVRSYGSSQFMQLLLVVGAARVRTIDWDRVAFGQLPLREFAASKTWLYYNSNGRVSFADRVIGDDSDPSRVGAASADDVCRIIDGAVRRTGFSQTFSPSSLTSCGVFNPIPINVEVQERKQNGDIETANNGITLTSNGWGAGGTGRYAVGAVITIVFAKAEAKKDNVAQEAAKEARYQLVESLDRGSTYMLGTAKFALQSITDDVDLDNNEIRATFRCIAAGQTPITDYDKRSASKNDDNFYTKALVKADAAAYQTVTACDLISFSMRVKLFRRIQGRARQYGDSKPDGYKISDNGVKARTAFYKVYYRPLGQRDADLLPVIIAARRSTDLDNFIGLDFKAGARGRKWDFRFDPIGDIGAEMQENGISQFAVIENSGNSATFTHKGNQFQWIGRLAGVSGVFKDRGPVLTNEWDLFSVRSDTDIQFSFESGPEFAITAVTEQQLGELTRKYDAMSMLAFGVFSGRGVQDLRSVTAYVTNGKDSFVVDEETGATSKDVNSTSYAPDIFADTVLDKENGIGKYAKPSGVEWQMLALSKRFCKNNGLGCQLFMDPLISEAGSWRQFWAEVAPYSLLEFAKIGGKETLVPAVPVNNAGLANRRVTISALFNQGNILEGSYREEFLDYGTNVQDLIATVIYRETESDDVFPRNASVDVRLRDTDESNAIRQSFDLSQYVTQREQAVLFAKLLCNQRRWARRGVEFQTFPTDSPISPGAYIYVDIGLNTWDQITSGVVMDNGELNAPLTDRIRDGQYSVLVHKAGDRVRTFDNVPVSSGRAPSLREYAGSMFVLGAAANRKRVFRVTEVVMSEEGEVTVKALEHPCEINGNEVLSRIADFSDALFTVV
jgi:hypothetical protein